MTAGEEASSGRNVGTETDIEDAVAFGLAVRSLRRARWLNMLGERLLDGSEAPLEPGEVDTLDEIAMNRGATMTEIADGLQITRSTATRAVERLETRGFAERYRDPESGRTVRVQLTRVGLAAYWELMDRRVKFMLRVFRSLDADQQRLVSQVLPRVVEIVIDELDRLPTPESPSPDGAPDRSDPRENGGSPATTAER